jgi:segregation and condensation protein A
VVIDEGDQKNKIDKEKEIGEKHQESEQLGPGPSNTKKLIAQPPLNLLFNPSMLVRKDVWNINIVFLLEMFLKLISDTGNKDLRICGLAAVSSSMIYRLKVESIFVLEKIAMQKKGLDQSADPNNPEQQMSPIPSLNPVELPIRVEPTYPVSVEDLLQMLETMIMELANPRPKRRKQDIELEPVESFDFDQYLVKFEKIIQGYEDMIYDIVSADGVLSFRTLVEKMEPIEVARCFIAMLSLVMKRKVEINQSQDSDNSEDDDHNYDDDDIKITLVIS